ncbi:hypothetical protein L0222_21375 [bacterium]|nr:hypothetical protein [bacterium]
MKKLIAFLISTVIPVFIPMCAIMTLPVCLAEKYLPRELQNSIQYGMRFFQLVWTANGDKQQQTPAAQRVTPVVESTVTSMTIASFEPESECEWVQKTTLAKVMIEPETVQIALDEHVMPIPVDPLESKINLVVEKAMQQKGIVIQDLQRLPDWKAKFDQEKLNIALERAFRQVELQVDQVKPFRKRHQKSIRVVVKNKPVLPA